MSNKAVDLIVMVAAVFGVGIILLSAATTIIRLIWK